MREHRGAVASAGCHGRIPSPGRRRDRVQRHRQPHRRLDAPLRPAYRRPTHPAAPQDHAWARDNTVRPGTCCKSPSVVYIGGGSEMESSSSFFFAMTTSAKHRRANRSGGVPGQEGGANARAVLWPIPAIARRAVRMSTGPARGRTCSLASCAALASTARATRPSRRYRGRCQPPERLLERLLSTRDTPAELFGRGVPLSSMTAADG